MKSVATIVTLVVCLGRQQIPDDAKARAQVRIETTMDALNCVFGNSDRRDPAAESDMLWSVRASVIPHEATEWHYTLKRRVGGRGEVELIRVLGTRVIGDPRTERARTCDDLRSWVRVDRRNVNTEGCAPIRSAVTRLQALQLPALPDASVTVDASQYFIVASTTEGDEYSWRITAGSRTNRRLSKTLAEWSDCLKVSVEACSK
jgi:hypothetical protein